MKDKAEVAIIQAKDGGFLVRPATFLADHKATKVVFRNFTNQHAVLVFATAVPPTTLILDPLDTITESGGADKGELKIDQLIAGVYPYHAFVGGKVAQGNSDPSIIVD
jgi:hypothetical protein